VIHNFRYWRGRCDERGLVEGVVGVAGLVGGGGGGAAASGGAGGAGGCGLGGRGHVVLVGGGRVGAGGGGRRVGVLSVQGQLGVVQAAVSRDQVGDLVRVDVVDEALCLAGVVVQIGVGR